MKTIKGYILYIDILGYKNLLEKNSSQENERVKDLLEQFTKIYSGLDFVLNFGQKYDKTKLLKRYFSDNFLYVYKSEKSDYSNLSTMQKIASQIQYQFLCCGMLTRGSLTYGEIEFSDDIVFGCDLIKAVELENHPEPSIIVDEALKEVVVDNKCDFNKHNSLFNVHGNSELDRQDVIKGINKYLVELNKIKPDKKYYEKISWVVDRVNEHFSETGHKCTLLFETSIRLVGDS